MIKNLSRGITLIEIVAVVFLVALFSAILVANFPEIQRQYSLSRATYKLAQDFRRVQDLGLSSIQLKDKNGELIKAVKGYGIYVNLSQPETAMQYILYADIDKGDPDDNQRFDGNIVKTCEEYQVFFDEGDCVIETIDVSENNGSVFISGVDNIDGLNTSVNFSPPGPVIRIDNLTFGKNEIGIVLGLRSGTGSRTVWANTAGLINVE